MRAKTFTASHHFLRYDVFLQVVTLVGEPFVFIKAMPKSGRCEDLDNPEEKHKHINCTGKVYGEHAKLVSGDNNDHCCYGKIIFPRNQNRKSVRVGSTTASILDMEPPYRVSKADVSSVINPSSQ